MAVTLSRDAPRHWVGVCELEIWVPPGAGPVWWAVDALLAGGAGVVFDRGSNATGNGAVVGTGSVEVRITFSGIQAATAGMVEVVVMYANSGSEAVFLVLVNLVPAGTMQLMPSGGAYVGAMVSVGLAAGKNFVTLVGGGEGVRVESLVVPVSSGAGAGLGPGSGSASTASSAA